jgi:hypothetical protein
LEGTFELRFRDPRLHFVVHTRNEIIESLHTVDSLRVLIRLRPLY